MKPRIRRVVSTQFDGWVCFRIGSFPGLGGSPEQAYEDWNRSLPWVTAYRRQAAPLEWRSGR
jgi:hypothetical protein